MEHIEDMNKVKIALPVTMIFVLALLALAIFQSNALLSLTYDFPPSFWSETLVAMAEQWHGWMQMIGTAGVTEAIAEWLESAHGQVVIN
ncbi:MAG: hypothetical protein V3V02_12430 [Rhizobiaceae bacterium]